MIEDKQNLRLWLNMLKTYRFMQNDLGEKLRQRFSMTLPQFQVMAQLANHPDGMTMSALSKSLLFSNGNTTGIIARMNKEGWIKRQAVKGDKRAIAVCLSPKGWDEFHKIMDDYQAWVDELLGGISPESSEVMIDFLRGIRG